jgi:hypothetical protein
MAIRIPERQSTDPTDRSIPPEAITSVAPLAMTMVMADWIKMFEIFAVVKKYGLRMENTMIKSTKARKMPDSAGICLFLSLLIKDWVIG